MKFATRLLFLCLGSVLIITVPVYLFLYHAGTNTIEQQIEQRLQDRTLETMEELDRMLFERMADVELMASIYSIRNRGSIAETTRRLIEYRNRFRVFSSISLFDSNRIRIVDTAGFALNQPADDALWVQDVFERNQNSTGKDVHFDPEVKRLMIFLATPAFDTDGNKIGALVARVSVENIYYLFNELDKETLAESNKPQVDLVNEAGLLIYSNHNYAGIGQQTDLLSSVKAAVIDNRFIRTVAQEPGHLNFEGNRWTLVIHYPREVALASLNALRNQAVAIGIVLLLFAMGAIFLAAHHTIKPIIALKNATLQLGKGNFQVEIPITSKDEIGELATSFNQMVKLVKSSKEKLRQEEEFLRLVIDNIPQMIFWKDIHGVYLGCNSKVVQMNQLNHFNDIIGKNDFDLVWKEFAPLYVADDRKVMTTKQPKLNFVEKVVGDKGTFNWLQTNKIPLYNSDGTVIGILGTAEDITSRMQAEELFKQYNQTLESEVATQTEELAATNEELQTQAEELAATNEELRTQTEELVEKNNLLEVEMTKRQQTEQLLTLANIQMQAILESTTDLICAVDTENRLIAFNSLYRKSAQEIFGVAIQIGSSRFDLYPKEVDRLKVEQEFKRVMQGESFVIEDIRGNKEEYRTYFELSYNPIIDDYQQVVGATLFVKDISVRKQAEEALRESEQKFVRLFIDMPIPLCFVNAEGAILHLSRRFTELFGYTHDDVPTITEWWQLAYPDETYRRWVLETWNVAVAKAVEQKTDIEQLEYEVICKNGMKRIMLIGGVTMGTNFLATFVDITERKQAEKALRKSEERFDLAMRGASDGLWDWNLETNEVYFSPRWKSMLGYEDHEIKSDFSEWHARVHPDDLEFALAGTVAYFEKKVPKYELYFRMRHKNGNYVWILSRAFALWNAEDKATRAVGTHVDMTEQKQAEEALRKSQRSLAEAQRIAHVGNWEWDVQTGGLTWSDEIYRIFGVQPQAFEPSYELFLNFVHPDDVAHLEQAIADALKGTKVYAVDHRIISSNAPTALNASHEIHFVHEQGEVIFDENNQPIRMLGIVQDITERKQIEAELLQAKNAADNANQAKSTFLANMSHELRTPLNGILGYTQILSRDKTITPKQQEGINIIHRSGEYLLTLINDILDLSKIEAGKVELYLTDFNFPEFIEGISELFHMRAQQKGINFIYEPLSRLPLGVRADEKRLRQVLINLLGNAVKFTEQGGVTLKIGYQADKIRFQVEDTGIGIAAEDIEKIFQPFQQSGDYSYKAEGTGLGLPITKKLIEMMGGELHVDSTLGRGSIFWMELDLPEMSELIKTEKERPPTIIGFEGSSRKLLVIDDKWANRSVMVNLLTPLGFEIIEAENGQEGLDKACEIQLDMVITDLVMPVMDGFEAVRQMRKIPKLQCIPIIAASASVFDYHQQQSKAAGCDAFMPKPFRAEMLFDLLQQHLNLTWIYAEEIDPSATATPVKITMEDMPFVGPSAKRASILLDLAMMGDIGGVLEALIELEKEDSKYLPFVDKVRRLAKNFEEEQICEIMQQYVN